MTPEAALAAAPASAGSVALDRADIERFSRFSHDVNPLHVDADYARRTPYGECVAHGMLGTWAALGALAGSAPIALRSLRCSFPAPTYLGTSYERVVVRRAPGEATVRLVAAGNRKLEVAAEFAAASPHAVHERENGWSPPAQPESPDPATLEGRRFSGGYAADLRYLAALAESLGIPEQNLPADQLECLGWVSYFCGMRVPGTQSLIFSVQLDFVSPPGAGGPIAYEATVDRRDERFDRLDISFVLRREAVPVCRGRIVALSRPRPVCFSLDAVRDAVGESDRLSGQVALVTGASRGLGATIAAALALHGSAVVLNYRRGVEEAEAVRAALEQAGARVLLAPGDVTSIDDCTRLRVLVAESFGRLDLLVDNASPPIRPFAVGELTDGLLGDFLQRTVAGYLRPVQALLPLLSESRGTIVAISSRYVSRPVPRFGHYSAAKAAVEALLHVATLETPGIRCLVVRPPKLRTDQTAVNFDLEPAQAPTTTAKQLLDALEAPDGGERFRVLEGD